MFFSSSTEDLGRGEVGWKVESRGCMKTDTLRQNGQRSKSSKMTAWSLQEC